MPSVGRFQSSRYELGRSEGQADHGRDRRPLVTCWIDRGACHSCEMDDQDRSRWTCRIAVPKMMSFTHLYE